MSPEQIITPFTFITGLSNCESIKHNTDDKVRIEAEEVIKKLLV